MRFQEIREKANHMNINTLHVKKMDIIRLILESENGVECYDTDWVIICNEQGCL